MKAINDKFNFPKVILMTADTVGGVWTYVLDLAEALERYHVEIHLATMGRLPDEMQHFRLDQSSNIILHESEYALEWMDNPWEDVEQAGKWLLGLEDKIQPDIIHLNGYCHGSLPWKAPVLVVAHSCVCSWWEAVLAQPLPKQYETYCEKVRQGLQSAAMVVAPTAAMMDSLIRNYGALPKREVIPNCCSFKQGSYPKEDFVFTMGRLWDQAKNISLLEKAATYSLWPVIVAGDTAFSNNQLPVINKNLHLIGNKSSDTIRNILERAAIYVHPAKYEPFGLSVLEAASKGCALILSDIESLRENWDGAALFVDANDYLMLASTLKVVQEDHLLREKLAAKALKRASKFSLSKMGQAYINCYTSLLLENKILSTIPL